MTCPTCGRSGTCSTCCCVDPYHRRPHQGSGCPGCGHDVAESVTVDAVETLIYVDVSALSSVTLDCTGLTRSDPHLPGDKMTKPEYEWISIWSTLRPEMKGFIIGVALTLAIVLLAYGMSR